MKTFLMCEPRFFEVSYVINPWMAGNLGRVDKALAARQWEKLHHVLSQRATIKLIEPVAGLPDMVFTANGGFVSPNRDVILSSFFHPERQPESDHFARYFESAGYHVKRLSGDAKFEGGGDALYGSDGKAWFGCGPRSELGAINQVAAILRIRPNALTLVDPRWYHLDTAFCPLDNGYVIAYAQAFSPQSVSRINGEFGDKVIWVSPEDANYFACNAVNIGNEVILYRASAALKAELDKRDFEIIEVEVTEFLKAGAPASALRSRYERKASRHAIVIRDASCGTPSCSSSCTGSLMASDLVPSLSVQVITLPGPGKKRMSECRAALAIIESAEKFSTSLPSSSIETVSMRTPYSCDLLRAHGAAVRRKATSGTI